MSRELPWKWSIFAASRNARRPIEPTASPAPESDDQLSPEQSPRVHGKQISLAKIAQRWSLPDLPEHISTGRKEKSCGGRSRKPSGDDAAKNEVGDALVTAPQVQTESEPPKRYVRLRLKHFTNLGEEKGELPGKENQHKEHDQVEEEQEAKKNGVEKHKVGVDNEEEQPRKIRKQVAENEVINDDNTPISKNLRSRNKSPQMKQKKGEAGSTSAGPKGGLKSVVRTNNFSRSLSEEEIQEDFWFMTGRLPPRRPKKRPKAVQVDTLYPGSELNLVCAQLYAVEEKPVRKRKRLSSF